MAGRDYNGEVQRIVETAEKRASECVTQDDLGEAKRVLADASRQLKAIKRDFKEQERSVRDSYQDARQRNAASGQTLGLFVSSKTRGSMARARARQGRKITAQKTEASRAFAQVYADIDRIVASLDREKAKLTDEIARRREAPRWTMEGDRRPREPASNFEESAKRKPDATPEPTPPRWAQDPLRRHEMRHWNGTIWTEHVADKGVAAIDPM